jgi:hypothetical protein
MVLSVMERIDGLSCVATSVKVVDIGSDEVSTMPWQTNRPPSSSAMPKPITMTCNEVPLVGQTIPQALVTYG